MADNRRYYQLVIIDKNGFRPVTYFDERQGSTNKRDARKLATEAHREHPDCEIGISYCTVDDSYCDDYIVIYAMPDDEDTEAFPNWGR